HGIRTLEAAREWRVAVQHDAGDGVLVRLAGETADLDVLKTVERKARRPGLPLRIATQNIVINGARLAKILRHEPAIGKEHLAVAQADRRARRPFDPQANDAGEILAEVE